MIVEWVWIENGDWESEAIVRRMAGKHAYKFQRDASPPHRSRGSMKLYWNVMLNDSYVAEFLVDKRLSKADKELAINLCLARYGGFFEEEEK